MKPFIIITCLSIVALDGFFQQEADYCTQGHERQVAMKRSGMLAISRFLRNRVVILWSHRQGMVQSKLALDGNWDPMSPEVS